MSLGYSFSALFAMLIAFFTGMRYSSTDMKEFEDERFLQLTRLVAIYCIADALWGSFYFGVRVPAALFSMVGYVVYLMAGIVTYNWTIYILTYMEPGAREEFIIKSVAMILLIFNGVLLISNAFTHDVFFVNSEGVYHVAEGRVQLQLIQAANFILITLCGIYKMAVSGRKRIREYVLMIICAILPALFGLGQILFIDASLYSIGFGLMIYLIFVYDKTSRMTLTMEEQHRKEREEQLSIIHGLAGNFTTVYSVDMETGGFIIYNKTGDGNNLKKADNSKFDYFKTAVEKGRRMVHPDDLEKFLLVLDRDIIRRYFEREDSFSMVLRICFGYTEKYVEYKFTLHKIGGCERLIVGVYDVDKAYRRKIMDAQILNSAKQRQAELEEETQLLDKAAHRDIMTGLYNRRAYEAYVQECKGRPDRDDFVYVSLDVNGLKAVNDDLGHEAGDELITGAAFCMKKALGGYGLIYRHGGDEFSAILHAPEKDLADIFDGFDRELECYEGKLVKEISVSYGYVIRSEAGDISIEEMSKIADKRMYEAKNQHYARKGIDRRSQADAYDAIRKSYLKILKVDLKTDTFATVYMDETESTQDKGYNASVSKWLHDFAVSGNVHPDDVDSFNESMDIDKIREHFSSGRDNIAIHYRRKNGSEYSNALLEIIESENFSEESQIVFLYVKNIH